MGRPLIVYIEAPERNDETETEDLAAFIEFKLPHWSGCVVWDERDFDSDVHDFGGVRDAIDANYSAGKV